MLSTKHENALEKNKHQGKFMKELSLRLSCLFISFALLLLIFGGSCCWAQEEEGSTAEIEAKLEKNFPSLVITGIDWPNFFSLLSKQAGVTIVPSPKVQAKGKVDVSLTDVTLRNILDEFLPLHGMYAEITPSAVKVMTEEERPEVPETYYTRTFVIKYTSVDKITQAIQPLKTPGGTIIEDQATKQIVVTDTASALSEMEEMIEKLDVETITRIFKIKYTDTEMIINQIQDILSGEKGSIQEDPKTGTLIITDIPENIERAAQIIEQLDVKTDLSVFRINFADPGEVIKLAKEFLSQDAFIEFDERTSQIVIDDIPSRVAKVADLIQRLDEPEKVVYIEAEIVDLNLTDKMDIGLDWEFGKAVDVQSASDLLALDPLIKIVGGNLNWTYLTPQNYKFALKALENTGDAKILASPRVFVKNNEGAKLQVGTEEPYSVRSNTGYRDDRYGGNDIYTQRSKDVGIILDVEVKINDAGYVEMDIELTNSSAELVNLSGIENSGLRVRKSEVKTIAPVKDGRTVAIGGLVEEMNNVSVSGVPFLSRIPIIGWIFGKFISDKSKHKLLLFLTPHIVPLDDPFRYTEQEDLVGDFKGEGELDLYPMYSPLTEEGDYMTDMGETIGDSFPLEYRESDQVVPLIEPEERDVELDEQVPEMDGRPAEPRSGLPEGVTEVPPGRVPPPALEENIPPEPLVETHLERLQGDLQQIEKARER